MQVHVRIINAFSIDGAGGNPAAVVLNADGWTTAQKQAIAAKINLSETAFVSASTVAGFKLDFFTPVRQIPHCGHATIGTFVYLKETGKISSDRSSKETIDGIRQIRFMGSEAYMEQKAPVFTVPDADDESRILTSLGLSENDLQKEVKPTIVNTGNSFLLIGVTDESILQNLKPDFNTIAALSEKYGLIGYYIFTKSVSSSVDATARMFAPAYGINEESATGMAAGPLACFLYAGGERKERYAIEQGRFMRTPSPSRIHVKLQLENDAVTSLFVGGSAVVSNEMTIDV